MIRLPEILLVLAIVLVIFGPKNLPRLGRQLGKGWKEFRGVVDEHLDKDADASKQQLTAAPESSQTAQSDVSDSADDAPVVDAEPVPESRSKNL